MSVRRTLYLMTSSLAVAGMIATPLQGFAQDGGPDSSGGAAPAYDQSQSQDPPARVGRLALVQGTVSTHAGGETQWAPAVLNAPATDGDAYWTEPQAMAEIEVNASSVWMNESTEFDLTTLNDTAMHAAEPQGETYIHLQSLQPGETYTIETPRGTVTMSQNGRYEIFAGDTQNPTTVSVLDGSAQISGAGISLQVGANQTATVIGDTSFQGTVGAINQDAFLTSMLQRDQPQQAQGAPPVVAQMTGCEDLNRYGNWQENADYGQVWYPNNVDSDWAPYRDGRWSYVAPWGWTWVDAAPWGFAPFHYGRWVQIGPRWGWAPVYPGYAYGGGYRPVYAPALVSFFGVGVGIGVGVGVGFGFGLGGGPAFGLGGRIGWVPLGAREAYYPPYGASRTYLNRVNITNIRNVTNIYNEAGSRRGMAIGQYANARAAVVVPARAMADSRPVRSAYSRPSASDLAGAHGLVGRAPIAPSGRTLGLTPRVAQQLHVANVERPHAAGPRVTAAPAAGGRPGALALRPGTGPARGAGPAAAPQRGGLEQRSGGMPALRQPGERPTAPGAERPGAENARGAERPGAGAPGPHIAAPGEAGRPQLRSPGAAPENHFQGSNRPAETPPARQSPGRPAETARPAPPQRNELPRQAAPAEHRAASPAPAVHHEAARPAAAPRPQVHAAPQARPAPRPAPAARPEPRQMPAARPAPRAMPAARPAPAPHAAPERAAPHREPPKH